MISNRQPAHCWSMFDNLCIDNRWSIFDNQRLMINIWQGALSWKQLIFGSKAKSLKGEECKVSQSHSEYDYYWIPAKRFVLCLLWKDLALQKWIWKMKWKLDFFHWWNEGENGWFVVIYSSPWAEVNLNSPALLVSVLLVKWSVWIVFKWFIRRLVSTLLSWSLLPGFFPSKKKNRFWSLSHLKNDEKLEFLNCVTMPFT